MKERHPQGSAWKQVDGASIARAMAESDCFSVWRRGPICAISSVDNCPPREWHVSVSKADGNPTPGDMAIVRAAFGMWGAVEESTNPAIRHLWLNPSACVECGDTAEAAK